MFGVFVHKGSNASSLFYAIYGEMWSLHLNDRRIMIIGINNIICISLAGLKRQTGRVQAPGRSLSIPELDREQDKIVDASLAERRVVMGKLTWAVYCSRRSEVRGQSAASAVGARWICDQ